MATGRDKMAITDNQPLGDTELQLLVDGFEDGDGDIGEIAVRDQTNRAFVVGPEVGLSYASGTNFISQTAVSNRRYGGYWQANWAAWDETDNGMSSVPFEDDGASTYFIGLRHFEVPTSATLQRSAALGHTFDRVAQRLGFRATILSVTNPVPAAGLLFTVASFDLGPGFANVSDARPVTVWLVNPVTATSEAVFTGTVVWDGVALEVQATHYFGQVEGAHSVAGGDYIVHVHGMSINKVVSLDLLVDGSGQQIYLLLGSFNSATAVFDVSGQVRAPSLGQLGAGTQSVASLVAAFRAGASIGDYETTRDWNDASNVTVNSGVDPVTFTFTNPIVVATRDYLFSGIDDGGTEPRLSQTLATGGLVATIAKSLATATYYVIAEVVEGASSTFEFRFVIVPAAGFTADQTRRLLRVYQFDFTTTTGAVAAQTPFDLNLRRGIADADLISANLDSAAGAQAVQELLAAKDNGTDFVSLDVNARDTTGGTPFATTGLARIFRRTAPVDAGVQILAPAGSGNLGNNERASIIFGNDPATGGTDYKITVLGQAGAPFITGRYSAADINFFSHISINGLAEDTAGIFRVEDFALTGSNGKLVWRAGDVQSANGDSGWAYRTNLTASERPDWRSSTVDEGLDIPIAGMPVAYKATAAPVVNSGHTLVEVRLHAGFALSTSALNNLNIVLYEHDPDLGLTTHATLNVLSPGAPDEAWRVLTPAAEITLTSDRNYFVRVVLDEVTAGPTAVVTGVTALYRVDSFAG